MSGRLQELGLVGCPYCLTDTVVACKLPVMLAVGGIPGSKRSRDRDAADYNALFMLMIQCNTCGYVRLFNSETFYGGDFPMLDVG